MELMGRVLWLPGLLWFLGIELPVAFGVGAATVWWAGLLSALLAGFVMFSLYLYGVRVGLGHGRQDSENAYQQGMDDGIARMLV